VEEGPTVIVILTGAAACRPDLPLVDALARLHLEVRRIGGTMYVRSPGDELAGLIELAGLSDVLRAD
jgi:hypothetical protein